MECSDFSIYWQHLENPSEISIHILSLFFFFLCLLAPSSTSLDPAGTSSCKRRNKLVPWSCSKALEAPGFPPPPTTPAVAASLPAGKVVHCCRQQIASDRFPAVSSLSWAHCRLSLHPLLSCSIWTQLWGWRCFAPHAHTHARCVQLPHSPHLLTHLLNGVSLGKEPRLFCCHRATGESDNVIYGTAYCCCSVIQASQQTNTLLKLRLYVPLYT